MSFVKVELHTEESLTNPDSTNVLEDKRLLNPHLFFMPPFKDVRASQEAAYVKKLCLEGLRCRYQKVTPSMKKRLNYELNIFDSIEGIYRYLILLIKIVRYALEQGITMAPGWSGSPGSLALYCLDIHQIDPLKHGLIFETFIRPLKEDTICVKSFFLTIPEPDLDQILQYFVSNFRQETNKSSEPKTFFELDIVGHPKETVRKEIPAKLLNSRRTIEIDKIPLNDAKALKLLLNEEKEGIFKHVFKYETEKTEYNFSQVAALITMQHSPEKTAAYIAAKNNSGKTTYKHPLLKKHLEETYGILVYQEQAVGIISDFSGFDSYKSAMIWKAILKKRSANFEILTKEFVKGCSDKGFDAEFIRELLDFLCENIPTAHMKSHYISEALLHYQTAYLKAYYPDYCV